VNTVILYREINLSDNLHHS